MTNGVIVGTISHMKVTFDQKKDELNIGKHRISLNDANVIRWDTLKAEVDNRRNYGETRYTGFAFIDDRLYCVVFTVRDDALRIISLRKANDREFDRYVRGN